jgi:hypothetical protein
MANGTIMALGTGGDVCVEVGTPNSVAGSTHVILDATGFVPSSASAQMPLLTSPVRLVDTRLLGGPIDTGGSSCFQVTGLLGIPNDAAAILLNVTAVGYGTRGWLTAYPDGQQLPTTSTLNLDPSEYAMANNQIVRVGSNGQICVGVGTVNSAPGSSQVILDATGYFSPTGIQQFVMLPSPQRAVDTRLLGTGPIPSGTSRCFTLAGQSGVPTTASGVVLNVTGVDYNTRGWVTVYPGPTVPAISTLNFDVSQYAVANATVVGLGVGGQVCVGVGTLNSAPGSSDVILDVVGYLHN